MFSYSSSGVKFSFFENITDWQTLPFSPNTELVKESSANLNAEQKFFKNNSEAGNPLTSLNLIYKKGFFLLKPNCPNLFSLSPLSDHGLLKFLPPKKSAGFAGAVAAGVSHGEAKKSGTFD